MRIEKTEFSSNLPEYTLLNGLKEGECNGMGKFAFDSAYCCPASVLRVNDGHGQKTWQ